MPNSNATSLPNIEQLIDGDGQITIGAIHPLRCVAIANDGHMVPVPFIVQVGGNAHAQCSGDGSG